MGWIIGAILAGVGSCSSNLGVNVQKYSFVKNAQLEKSQQRKYIRQPLWLLGLLLVTCGSMGDFIALSMAAQSIVAPIGSVTLVTNVLFAHWGLGEKIRFQDLIGTLMIISGSVLSVAFGDHEQKFYTVNDLTALYFGALFIVYAILVTLLLTLLYLMVSRMNPVRARLLDTIKRWESLYNQHNPANEQLLHDLDTTIHMLEQRYKKFEKLHPFSLCATAGLYGSLSVLFGKMVAELLGSTFRGVNQLNEFWTWMFVICMFVTVIAQLHYMAMALNSFDALYCVPVFQCFFISGSTLGGACFFKEFNSFSTLQAVLFPIGLTCTLTGVVILSSRQMHLKRNVDGAAAAAAAGSKSGKKMKRKHSNGTHHQLIDSQLDDSTMLDDVEEVDELQLSPASRPNGHHDQHNNNHKHSDLDEGTSYDTHKNGYAVVDHADENVDSNGLPVDRAEAVFAKSTSMKSSDPELINKQPAATPKARSKQQRRINFATDVVKPRNERNASDSTTSQPTNRRTPHAPASSVRTRSKQRESPSPMPLTMTYSDHPTNNGSSSLLQHHNQYHHHPANTRTPRVGGGTRMRSSSTIQAPSSATQPRASSSTRPATRTLLPVDNELVNDPRSATVSPTIQQQVQQWMAGKQPNGVNVPDTPSSRFHARQLFNTMKDGISHGFDAIRTTTADLIDQETEIPQTQSPLFDLPPAERERQLADRLKYYTSVGHVSNGLYAQLPLFGPLAQLLTSGRNNNEDDEQVDGASMFGSNFNNGDSLNTSIDADNVESSDESLTDEGSDVDHEAGDDHHSNADFKLLPGRSRSSSAVSEANHKPRLSVTTDENMLEMHDLSRPNTLGRQPSDESNSSVNINVYANTNGASVAVDIDPTAASTSSAVHDYGDADSSTSTPRHHSRKSGSSFLQSLTSAFTGSSNSKRSLANDHQASLSPDTPQLTKSLLGTPPDNNTRSDNANGNSHRYSK